MEYRGENVERSLLEQRIINQTRLDEIKQLWKKRKGIYSRRRSDHAPSRRRPPPTICAEEEGYGRQAGGRKLEIQVYTEGKKEEGNVSVEEWHGAGLVAMAEETEDEEGNSDLIAIEKKEENHLEGFRTKKGKPSQSLQNLDDEEKWEVENKKEAGKKLQCPSGYEVFDQRRKRWESSEEEVAENRHVSRGSINKPPPKSLDPLSSESSVKGEGSSTVTELGVPQLPAKRPPPEPPDLGVPKAEVESSSGVDESPPSASPDHCPCLGAVKTDFGKVGMEELLDLGGYMEADGSLAIKASTEGTVAWQPRTSSVVEKDGTPLTVRLPPPEPPYQNPAMEEGGISHGLVKPPLLHATEMFNTCGRENEARAMLKLGQKIEIMGQAQNLRIILLEFVSHLIIRENGPENTRLGFGPNITCTWPIKIGFLAEAICTLLMDAVLLQKQLLEELRRKFQGIHVEVFEQAILKPREDLLKHNWKRGKLEMELEEETKSVGLWSRKQGMKDEHSGSLSLSDCEANNSQGQGLKSNNGYVAELDSLQITPIKKIQSFLTSDITPGCITEMRKYERGGLGEDKELTIPDANNEGLRAERLQLKECYHIYLQIKKFQVESAGEFPTFHGLLKFVYDRGKSCREIVSVNLEAPAKVLVAVLIVDMVVHNVRGQKENATIVPVHDQVLCFTDEGLQKLWKEGEIDQWDPGGHPSLFLTAATFCFKQWDPGKVCSRSHSLVHLEDKVNFEGEGIDADMRRPKKTLVYERGKWKPIKWLQGCNALDHS